MTPEDIENRFTFHEASRERNAALHSLVRNGCRQLAEDFNEALPEGREKALAVTHLEEAMFWANASLARSTEVG